MSKGLKLIASTQFQQKLKLPSGVLIAAIIAVAILATSFSGFKPTAFATAVSTCQNINAAGSYQLTGNLFSIGTCINITSDNTELDCNGFWINSTNGTVYAAGVNVSSVDNVTVRNCKVARFISVPGNSYGGITATNSTNLTIGFNTLINNSAAIYLVNINNSVIANNTILNTTTSFGYGIFMDVRQINNTIKNNTIRNTAQDGIYLGGGMPKFPFYNNIIENNTIEYTFNSGIRIDTGTETIFTNTTISNNIIRHVGSSYGIAVAANVYNITVAYNTVFNTSYDSIYFAGDTSKSGNQTIHSNTVYNSTSYGIQSSGSVVSIYNNTIFNNYGGIFTRANNITIFNNTIRNHTDIDGGYAIYRVGGIDVKSNVTNNTIESNNYGIYLATPSTHTTNISLNSFKYNRIHALQIVDDGGIAPVDVIISRNTFCYNNASIDNFTVPTSRYIVGNNTFCAERVAPAENTLYSDVTSFTVNVTNTFNTTKGQSTSCSLFVNGANVSTRNNIGEKLNTTFTYTPTASGNWYVYCADTFNPNTANSSLFTLSAAAAPPASGGSTGGEVKPPIIPKVKDFTLSAVNSIIQIFLGKSAANSLLIQNTGEEDLVFSSLSVTGVDSSWLSLPSSLPTVLAGSSATLDIGISVPKDAAPKLYTAHASTTASGITRSTSFDVRIEAACDGCFLAKLRNNTIAAGRGQSVYNQLTITNVGNVKLKASIATEGENKNWLLLSSTETDIAPDQDQTIDIEITPTISEQGVYPINITIGSGFRTETLAMLVKVLPGCNCAASQPIGSCINGKQTLTAYQCSEATAFQCEPTQQEVSCALVKKKKLLLPFWEAPIEHLEANLWWLLILVALALYAGYKYYKKKQADKIKIQP